jgi:hypothetical protein
VLLFVLVFGRRKMGANHSGANWEEMSFDNIRDPIIEGTVARMKLRSLTHVGLSEDAICQLTRNISSPVRVQGAASSSSCDIQNGPGGDNSNTGEDVNYATDSEDFDDSTLADCHHSDVDENARTPQKIVVSDMRVSPESNNEEYLKKMAQVIKDMAPKKQQGFFTQQFIAAESLDSTPVKSVERLTAPEHSVDTIQNHVPFSKRKVENDTNHDSEIVPANKNHFMELEFDEFLEAHGSVPRSCASCMGQPLEVVFNVFASLIIAHSERLERLEDGSAD